MYLWKTCTVEMKRFFLAVTHRPGAGKVPHGFDFILKELFCWLEISSPDLAPEAILVHLAQPLLLNQFVIMKGWSTLWGGINILQAATPSGLFTFCCRRQQQQKATSICSQYTSTHMHSHNDHVLQNITSHNKPQTKTGLFLRDA